VIGLLGVGDDGDGGSGHSGGVQRGGEEERRL